MSLRSLAWFPPARQRRLLALAIALLPLGAALASANDFIDSGGRRVLLPARIGRVMAAEPDAQVLIFALTPQKLVGWARVPLRGQMPGKYARLRTVGTLAGTNPTVSVDTVRRVRPDLIIDCGQVDPARVAFADQVQQATGIPYILVDDSIDRIPEALRTLGGVLGVQSRGNDLALYGEYAIDSLRGRLLIQSADQRPRIYYGRGPSGLDAALPGTPSGEMIAQSGAINVAAALEVGRPPGQPAMMTADLLRQWDPGVIIAEDRDFYNSLHRPAWRGLAAVRKKAVYLAPSTPFGWIDDPAGVNRLIGLYWLSTLLYPSDNQEDLRSQVHDFYQKFYGMTLTDAQVEAMVRAAGLPPNPTPTLGSLPETMLPSGPGIVPGGRVQPRPVTPPGAGLPATPSGRGLPVTPPATGLPTTPPAKP